MFLSGAEIRSKFIAYFRDKRNHLHLPSSSLIPDNPTLLLTSAGMVQFVPIFLGQAEPTIPPRAVTCQKCARAGGKDSDIENVGRTARHHSFFEMLGNFSFGDYFKSEIIPWAWEFVTRELGLPPEALSVTVFRGDEEVPADEEAFEIWHRKVGIPTERIYRMSRKDNFWGPPGPTGPCGPCSEIYYDRGEQYRCHEDPEYCGIGRCECDRYLEIWNLVFMQLFKDEHGKFSPLAKKNVDTGMGLERVALILQNKHNSFETDLFLPILQEVSKLANVSYSGKLNASSPEEKAKLDQDIYMKIIADHARCVAFLIGDGIRMSNVGRGYVLRFITRRAARFGRLLGMKDPFIYKLIPTIVQIYGAHYEELAQNQKLIEKVIKDEEERFAKTIDRGMSLLEQLLASSANQIDGREAFNLYSTYGFPLELTREIAHEHCKMIDMEGFVEARSKHEAISAGNKFNVVMTGDDELSQLVKKRGGTNFVGYEKLKADVEVIALVQDKKVKKRLEEGEEAEIILDSTPFYAESGGQLGDVGRLVNDDVQLAVLDTQKQDGLYLHKVRVLAGELVLDTVAGTGTGTGKGIVLQALVDEKRRLVTKLHHSSAHVFHAAIRELFGKQVVQAGSQVGPNTMRFDFTLDRQPTPAELERLEAQMNEWVRINASVETVELPIEEAKRTGAVAMFGEKYGDIVRVVKMGDFSLEFCGGTHVASTGEIGSIKLISEGSIASGVRRIEAVSGPIAWQYIAQQMTYLSEAAEKLKTRPADLLSQIERLQEQLKQKEKITQALEEKLALAKVAGLKESVVNMENFQLISESVEDVSADALKKIAENLLEDKALLVIVLGTVLAKDKVALVAAVSPALVKQGFNAGVIVKEVAGLVDGSGGGRPELAQAGGKNPSKLRAALAHVKDFMNSSAFRAQRK